MRYLLLAALLSGCVDKKPLPYRIRESELEAFRREHVSVDGSVMVSCERIEVEDFFLCRVTKMERPR